MTDYYKLLNDCRVQQLEKFRKVFNSPSLHYDCTDHYHTEINDRDTLLITMGDSWTWGASLDPALKYKQIYGAHLKQQLNCDWINIGCQGWSNSFILENLGFLGPHLQESAYKNIIVVINLTENGRDVQSTTSFRYNYSRLRDTFGVSGAFYENLLLDIERYWIRQIDSFLEKTDSRFQVVLTQNFVWHLETERQLKDRVKILDLNWIECLADAQQLPRPIRTNLVTGWIFRAVDSVHDILNITDRNEFKQWSLPYLDRANQVNKWLDSSPVNYEKSASKHPNATGHQIWADYIMKNL